MAQGSGFVRVPPQSTGRRVATEVRSQLAFNNLTGIFEVGDVVTGGTSGATGTVTGVERVGFPAGEGLLWLRDATGTFTNNENLQVSSVTQAISNLDIYFYETYDYAQNVIVDPNNPVHRQTVDQFGAAATRFADGAPTFGSFGTLNVGEPQVIKDHRFAYNGHDSQFWDQTSGGGSIAYQSAEGHMLLSTGTANADLASRTSNFYHPYGPGVGHLIEITLRHGDSGKAGNRRRWGYFDDDNGVFFELDGTDLYVVVRSNTSGSPVDTRIAQTNWNTDKLDGTGNIAFDMDITNANIYWIDLQWLGAGRVRFGVVEPGGSRIVGHVVEHSNNPVGYPYMRTATLPIRIENENTGAAASTSEIRFACAAVKHSSRYFVTGDRRTGNSGVKTIVTGSEIPLFAVRAAQTFGGITNRAIARTTSIGLANITGTGSGPVLYRIRAVSDLTTALTGESFATPLSSAFEVDNSASAINTTGTIELGNFIVEADGTTYIDNNDSRQIHSWEVCLGADGVSQPGICITAECLSGTNADVVATVNWEEIKL